MQDDRRFESSSHRHSTSGEKSKDHHKINILMTKDTIYQLFGKVKIQILKANNQEIREGWLFLKKKKWLIHEGILFAPTLALRARKEQEAIKVIDSRPDLGGGQIEGLAQNIYSKAMESLPEANQSPFFAQKSAFLNISLGKTDYFKFFEAIKGKKLAILEIGADAGWSARRLAKAGHRVIALDISPHLAYRNNWLKKGILYEAISADMNEMPFISGVFDFVFASASIHHSHNLKKIAKDIFRLLKPGGKFLFLREPVKGARVKGKEFGKKQKELGVSENLYSKDEWQSAFKKAGFKDIKIQIAKLDYPKFLKLNNEKLIYLLKIIKRYLMIIPAFKNRMISDYNISGKKL